jgi:hypothetical protein
LSETERKNGWQLAEHAREARASWDATPALFRCLGYRWGTR